MDNETMNARICACTPDITAISILQRGFVTCDNKREQEIDSILLLTGINPSYDALKGLWPGKVRPFPFQNARGSFWNKKKEQFGDLWAEMAYLDLFPIRETDQRVFEKAFHDQVSLRRDLLEITQDAIEEMHPDLIVHANRGSMYYWGIDDKNPWMGYKLERVKEDTYQNLPPCMLVGKRLDRFKLYRINGFVDSEKRINRVKYPNSTSLFGHFLMEYVMEYRKPEDKALLYKPEEWKEIWNWVKDLKQ